MFQYFASVDKEAALPFRPSWQGYLTHTTSVAQWPLNVNILRLPSASTLGPKKRALSLDPGIARLQELS